MADVTLAGRLGVGPESDQAEWWLTPTDTASSIQAVAVGDVLAADLGASGAPEIGSGFQAEDRSVSEADQGFPDLTDVDDALAATLMAAAPAIDFEPPVPPEPSPSVILPVPEPPPSDEPALPPKPPDPGWPLNEAPCGVFELSTLDGTNGFAIGGTTGTGAAVASAGDINGDGLTDIMVGSSTGEQHLIFGKAGGFSAHLDLTTLDGNNGFAINGRNINKESRDWLASAGDVNADG